MKLSHDGLPPVRHYQRLSRAAFYVMYLRQIEGFSPDEARALVGQRYPEVGRAIRRQAMAKGARA